jgi:hypothetical protein
LNIIFDKTIRNGRINRSHQWNHKEYILGALELQPLTTTCAISWTAGKLVVVEFRLPKATVCRVVQRNLEQQKNIVVTGLDEEEWEIEKKLEKWVKAELEVEVTVKEMYKINGGKMIVAELESWGEKRKVMENKRKLREKKGKRIYIEDDLTKKERDIQKELRALTKEERQKGLRVKVGYKKIWIEGKGFRWD